jgi:CheY-like chemotaxis protein
LCNASRFVIGAACLLLLLPQAHGQPRRQPPPRSEDTYRQFLKKPETAAEYWAAIKFEVNVGKYKLAAEDLKAFLAYLDKNPSENDLIRIVDEEGMAPFLHLLTIPDTRADAGKLIDRVRAVMKKHRSDPQRIKTFIDNLSATPEEREFAIAELRKSGAVAVPYLVDALRETAGTEEHTAILSALPYLGRDSVPPLLAALDIPDSALRIELIDVLERRNDAQAVPYLWFLSANPKEGTEVRRKATEALTHLLGQPANGLPPAKLALTDEAERYYRHRVHFSDPQAVVVWQWDGKRLVGPTLTGSQAEEYYGLRFARQAIELDPAYLPAQVLFLSLALDKGVERSGLERPLEKGAAGVKELVKVINPALLNSVLDRALTDRRLPVIVGAARALGDEGAVEAIRPVSHPQPPLVRALYYPDRRVQLAAADALLRIPAPEVAAHGARIVEVLRRTLAADPMARAVVGDFNQDRGTAVGRALREAGFEPVVVATGREVLLRLRQAADVDVALIDSDIPDPQLPYLLAQLRADVNVGLMPVLVTTPPDRGGTIPNDVELRLRHIMEPYRNVWLVPTPIDAASLKRLLASRLAETMGQPLSEAERKDHAAEALLWLKRLAVGELPGYDVRPAEAAILKALETDELASVAIEAAGRLPGRRAQRALAGVVLGDRKPEFRAQAAVALAHHVEQHGLALAPEQVRGIEIVFATTRDAKLRSAVALALGSFRPDAQVTGARLEQYRPPLAAPPPPPRQPREREK